MKILGRGSASGKIILAGEHAVVYNQPAIAVPFFAATIETLITPTLQKHTLKCSYYEGDLESIPYDLVGLKAIILNTLDHLEITQHYINVEIISSLPSGSGLGSSASVSISVVRGLFDYFDVEIDDEILLKLVETAEEIYHLNPSGIDMKTIASSKPIWFENKNDVSVLDTSMSGYIVVADSGIKGNTKEAIREVRNLIEKDHKSVNHKMESIGAEVRIMQKHIYEDRLKEVGKSMTQVHTLLQSINVSNEVLDSLVTTALNAGALGSKLTGSGKGGCVIALSDNHHTAQNIAEAMKQSGAKQTWIYNLKGEV